MSLIDRVLDERFLAHRQRSTSFAGIACAFAAIALFAWRFYGQGTWSWDLVAVVGVFIAVKLSLLAWHLVND